MAKTKLSVKNVNNIGNISLVIIIIIGIIIVILVCRNKSKQIVDENFGMFCPK